MRSPNAQLIGAALVLLLPAVVGVFVGRSQRAAPYVRALGASALLLTISGYVGLALLLTRAVGAPAVLSYLALWLGITLGALTTVVGCAAGLIHAMRLQQMGWFRALLLGSLLPLVLAAALVGAELATLSRQSPDVPTSAALVLLVAMALAGIAPFTTLAYGVRAAQVEWRRSHEPVERLDEELVWWHLRGTSAQDR
jgi:hypothetical protein